MHIKTVRFGRVEVASKDIITFPQGLVGFSHLKKFVLLDDPKDQIFIWLQSCEDPEVAFVVLESQLFTEDYEKYVHDHNQVLTKNQKDGATQLFSVITLGDKSSDLNANLQAPLLINFTHQIGQQLVLQDSPYRVDEPIFKKLNQRIVNSQQKGKPFKSNGSWSIISVTSNPKE